jgi:DNA-binding MarR family transcriptional regulator
MLRRGDEAEADRLERDGLLHRAQDREDARSVIVTLTARRVVDEIAPAHLDNEQRLLNTLSAGEQRELVKLLRKLLQAREADEAFVARESLAQ